MSSHRRALVALALVPLLLACGKKADTDLGPEADLGPDAGFAPAPEEAEGPVALEWVELPEGVLSMGEEGVAYAEPVHTVVLSAFEMLRHEVTPRMYAPCVTAGVCSPPGAEGQRGAWEVTGQEDLPLSTTTWFQARAFCEWAGGRLPSEAEWEFAARSAGQNWPYPWGEAAPSCRTAILDGGAGLGGTNGPGCGQGRPWHVGSRRSGDSEQGIADLAGNAAEWVYDCWHDSYFDAPDDGSPWPGICLTTHVVRGGAWHQRAADLRATARGREDGDSAAAGFRCARDLP